LQAIPRRRIRLFNLHNLIDLHSRRELNSGVACNYFAKYRKNMNKEKIIKLVIDAFNGVDQPKNITLHVAEAHDNYDYTHDDDHRKSDYIGPWQELPSSYIKKCQTALSYLDKIGLRFYLPAYMVWYLKNFGNRMEISHDHTLHSLDNHPNDQNLADNHKDRFSLFTTEQLTACAKFVKYCANDKTGFTDNDFAKKIYESYWTQFDK
jgi:hypothetical protein